MEVVALTKGPLVTALVAGLSMAGVVGAFVSSANPYVTVAQARHNGGDGLHLAGVLVKGSCGTSLTTGRTEFTLRDKEGQTVRVEHYGVPPPTLLDADKVVAIGTMRPDGHFVSHDLLVKCPTKYEEKPKNPLGRAS